MQTTKWGSSLWISLHTMAHNYDPKVHKASDYKKFFELLGEMLPCKYCRESYKGFIAELPIDPYLGSQRDLTYWLYLMHNKVNDKLRKQGLLTTKDPTYEQIYAKYENFRADCTKKKDKPSTCRLPDFENRCKSKTSKGRQCTRPSCMKGGVCMQHYKCNTKKSSK